MTKRTMEALHLKGVSFAASQCWGSIRLVPILKASPESKLRIAKKNYGDPLNRVNLNASGTMSYHSYIPHGFVMSWDERGLPISAYGTNLRSQEGREFGESVGVAHRMVKRESENRIRVLPLHLAMEGFLSLHFGGPSIAWCEYSKTALKHGLSPRRESSFSGRWISGLAEALRIFEIHEEQVGVACFVADALASVFIVSHPDDYRLLHLSLLEDFFGEILYQYGLMYSHVQSDQADLELDGSTFDSLRDGLADLRVQWSENAKMMVGGLWSRSILSEMIYKSGPFQLKRFMTDLTQKGENHLGEMIQNESGQIEYLKTFRLSSAQTKRAYILRTLAEHEWNIEKTATFLGQSKEEWILRMDNAGFSYLLKEHVIAEARRILR